MSDQYIPTRAKSVSTGWVVLDASGVLRSVVRLGEFTVQPTGVGMTVSSSLLQLK